MSGKTVLPLAVVQHQKFLQNNATGGQLQNMLVYVANEPISHHPQNVNVNCCDHQPVRSESTSSCSTVTNDSSSSSLSNSDSPSQQLIDIPAGWKRILTNDGQIIYFSPSNVPLNSFGQLHEYLQTQGTCKCGLECPVKVENHFNFDPKVLNKQWSTSFHNHNLEPAVLTDMTKLCNHKRKLLNSQSSATSNHLMLPDKQIPSTNAITSFHHHNKDDDNEVLQCKKRKCNMNFVENSNNINNTSSSSNNKPVADNNNGPFAHQQELQIQQTYPNQQQSQPQSQPQLQSLSQQAATYSVKKDHKQQLQLQLQNQIIAQSQPQPQPPVQQQSQIQQSQPFWYGTQYPAQQQPNYMQQYQSSEISSTMQMQQRHHHQNYNNGYHVSHPPTQNQSQPQPQLHNHGHGHGHGHGHTHSHPYLQQQPSHSQQMGNMMPMNCHLQEPQQQANYFMEQYPRNYGPPDNNKDRYSNNNNNNFYQNQFQQQGQSQVQSQHPQDVQPQQQTQPQHYPPSNFIRSGNYNYPYQQTGIPSQQQQQHQNQNQNQNHYHGQNQYNFNNKGSGQTCLGNGCQDAHFAQQHAVPNPHQKHLPIWHQTLQQQPQQQPQQIVPIHHQNQCMPANPPTYCVQRMQVSQFSQAQYQSQFPIANQHSQIQPQSQGQGHVQVHQAPQLQAQPSEPQSNSSDYWKSSNDLHCRKKHKKQSSQKKNKFYDKTAITSNNTNNVPSFMDDPNGYLAQQTALLNNTISRQINSHQNPNLNPNPNSNSNPCYSTFSENESMSNRLKINTNNDNLKKSEPLPEDKGLSTIASSLESKIDDVGGFPSSCSSSSSSSSSYDNSQLLDNRPIQAGAISTSNGSPDVSESTSSTSSTPVTFTPTLNPVEVFNQNSSTITNSNSTTSTTCASTTVTTSTTTTTTVTISTPNSSQMRVSSSKVLDRNQHIAQNCKSMLPKPANDNMKILTENEPNTVPTTKTPLEMVQSIVSSIQVPPVSTSTKIDINNSQGPNYGPNQNYQQHLQQSTASSTHSNVYVSTNTGQVLVATSINQTANGNLVQQKSPLLPFTSKIIPTSNSNCSNSAQILPATVNLSATPQTLLATTNTPQTLLLNTIPGQFVIQQQPTTLDNNTNQIQTLPQLLTGNLIQTQQAMLATQSNQVQNVEKRRSNKKRKSHHHHHQHQIQQQAQVQVQGHPQMQPQTHQHHNVPIPLIQLQQQNTGIILQQQPNLQVLQQNVECNGQTLTIVPNKGTSTATTPFASQLINAQPAQQINLLQHVNVVNGATGLVHNFPTIQQFIVPTNLSGMLMTSSDGTTTFVQDTTASLQFQLQNINGQSILTAIPNTATANAAVFPTGMVIRTQNGSQNKLIQQPSPNASSHSNTTATIAANQFLSPTSAATNSQFVVNGSNQFIANLNQNNAHHQNPIKNNNTTFVQQNTTIVQQQTTMVSNQQQQQNQASSLQNQQAVAAQTALSQQQPPPHVMANLSPPDTTVASPLNNSTNQELKMQQKQSMVHFVSSSGNSADTEVSLFKNQQIFNSNSLVRTTTTIETTQRNLQDAVISGNGFEEDCDYCEEVDDEEVEGDDEECDGVERAVVENDESKRAEQQHGSNGKGCSAVESAENGTKHFKVGQLVWGSNGVKSVWPGKILNFIDGENVTIQWFGCNNKSVANLPILNLKTLSEGLESHHSVRMKFRKSRKLNSVLEKAIQEAMFELDHQQSKDCLKSKPKKVVRKSPKKLQNDIEN